MVVKVGEMRIIYKVPKSYLTCIKMPIMVLLVFSVLYSPFRKVLQNQLMF